MTASTTRRALPLVLTLTALACGGHTAWPAGEYALDLDAFAEHGAEALIASGQIPPQAAEPARRELRKVHMQLDLQPGGEFSCAMGTPDESHVFTGTWQLQGKRMTLQQTHQDGEPVTDSMSGTLEGNDLRLHHDENGMQMTYLLRREGAPAAAPR